MGLTHAVAGTSHVCVLLCARCFVVFHYSHVLWRMSSHTYAEYQRYAQCHVSILSVHVEHGYFIERKIRHFLLRAFFILVLMKDILSQEHHNLREINFHFGRA